MTMVVSIEFNDDYTEIMYHAIDQSPYNSHPNSNPLVRSPCFGSTCARLGFIRDGPSRAQKSKRS
jgi:hypothetical protein